MKKTLHKKVDVCVAKKGRATIAAAERQMEIHESINIFIMSMRSRHAQLDASPAKTAGFQRFQPLLPLPFIFRPCFSANATIVSPASRNSCVAWRSSGVLMAPVLTITAPWRLAVDTATELATTVSADEIKPMVSH